MFFYPLFKNGGKFLLISQVFIYEVSYYFSLQGITAIIGKRAKRKQNWGKYFWWTVYGM